MLVLEEQKQAFADATKGRNGEAPIALFAMVTVQFDVKRTECACKQQSKSDVEPTTWLLGGKNGFWIFQESSGCHGPCHAYGHG